MTALRYVFEGTFEFALKQAEFDVPLFRTQEFAKRSGPKPVTSPYGPHYRMHPELSRPTIGIISSTILLPAAVIAGPPVALAAMNYAVIENDVPEEERQGFWRMFSQALTGGFGANLTGLV